MDPDLKRAQYISACIQWKQEHPDTAVGFEFLEAAETNLQFRANGMLFQLLLPLDLLEADVGSEEGFIAMNLDNSAPESLVMALNEKLERVRVGPFALQQVLDIFSKALTSFKEKRGRPQTQLVEQRSSKDLQHDSILEVVSVKDEKQTDIRVMDLSDDETDAHSGGYDPESDDGGDDGCLGSDGGDYDDDYQHFTPDDFENEDVEYSLKKFKDQCLRRTGGAGPGQSGYLYQAAQVASGRCDLARNRSIDSVLSSPPRPTFSGALAITYMEDILRFCNVSTVPNLSWMRLQAEMTGLVNDVKLAAALGLSFGKTLHLFLEFDKMFWCESSLRRPLEVNRVCVRLVDNCTPETYRTEDRKEPLQKDTDEEFEAESKKFPGRHKILGYGIDTLLPELVHTFFKFRAGERVENLRSKAWKNEDLDEALKYSAEIDNPFLGLLCFIGSQLRALPSWCAICWSLLPASVWRLRTCQDDLCLYKFEELGLGATIHQEIQESPEVVDFELSLACAAAISTRDVFEPFPAFLLTKGEVRGRSGWFSKQSGPIGQFDNIPTSRAVSTSHAAEIKNKKLGLLLELLQTIPSLEELNREGSDENSLRRHLSKAAFVLHKKRMLQSNEMWLSYDLMRFILSTNRLSLRLLKGSERLVPSIQAKYQFVVLHDSPEKEAIFEEHRSQKGSFFAFHGSRAANWYSILRNGLRSMSKTQYMSAGAAYGDGIYLADNFALSYGYARASDGSHSWRNGNLKDGMIVMAVCEVVKGSTSASGPQKFQTGGIYVVPPGHEDDLAVRFLIVMETTALGPEAILQSVPGTLIGGKPCSRSITINGTVLHDMEQINHTSETLDLRIHYEQLRIGEQLKQQSRLLEYRMKVFKRLKDEMAQLHIDSATTHCDRTPPPASVTSATVEVSSVKSKHAEFKHAGEHRNVVVDGVVHNPKRLKENNSAPTMATATATQAITKEHRNILNEMQKAKKVFSSAGGHPESFLAHITVHIPNESNMYVWQVFLHQSLFKSYAKLYKDLQELAASKHEPEAYVVLEVTFSGMYPFQPPFVRVVRPRFQFHTGHITVGGSICMELLTDSGWLPSFSFESVLVQIVNAFVEGEGRVDKHAMGQDYSMREAQEAFTRVAGLHGWKVSTNRR